MIAERGLLVKRLDMCDSRAEMYVIAAAAALVLMSPSPRPFEKHRRHPVRTRFAAAGGRMTWNLFTLAVRHELLHDFLVEARSERPAFYDARVVDAGDGLRIGPTSVDVDFLGAAIVRARVVNGSDRFVDALVVVAVEDSRGRSSRASVWIDRLAPHADRQVELFSPTALEPASVHWSVTPP